MSTIGGLIVALGAMFAYRAVARDGLVWFGVSLVVAFLAATVVEVVRSGALRAPGEGGK